MPDSYYPEAEDAASNSTPTSADTSSEDTETAEEQTALLPKTILAGKQFDPGDEVVLKIVKVYENEVEVAYATGDEEETANQPMQEPSPDMEASEGALESMAE